MMRLVSVSQSYDGDPVLENVSLSVSPGEVLGIIGPSGVGKTTVLRTLGLFLQPTDGEVELDGQGVWSVDDRSRLALRRQIGMVFQEPSLFDGTVERNVGYGLRVRRPWKARLKESLVEVMRSNGTAAAVEEALELVDLEDKRTQNARALSGGEAQRVSFARALAYEPNYLLLDEPTSDLDPRNTAMIEDAIAAASDRGIGVVLATHDMHQAQRVADRVGVLLDTDFSEIGRTDQIFESPRNERTRKFISGELVY